MFLAQPRPVSAFPPADTTLSNLARFSVAALEDEEQIIKAGHGSYALRKSRSERYSFVKYDDEDDSPRLPPGRPRTVNARDSFFILDEDSGSEQEEHERSDGSYPPTPSLDSCVTTPSGSSQEGDLEAVKMMQRKKRMSISEMTIGTDYQLQPSELGLIDDGQFDDCQSRKTRLSALTYSSSVLTYGSRSIYSVDFTENGSSYHPSRASVQTYGSSVLTYGSRASAILAPSPSRHVEETPVSRPCHPLPWEPRLSSVSRRPLPPIPTSIGSASVRRPRPLPRPPTISNTHLDPSSAAVGSPIGRVIISHRGRRSLRLSSTKNSRLNSVSSSRGLIVPDIEELVAILDEVEHPREDVVEPPITGHAEAARARNSTTIDVTSPSTEASTLLGKKLDDFEFPLPPDTPTSSPKSAQIEIKATSDVPSSFTFPSAEHRLPIRPARLSKPPVPRRLHPFTSSSLAPIDVAAANRLLQVPIAVRSAQERLNTPKSSTFSVKGKAPEPYSAPPVAPLRLRSSITPSILPASPGKLPSSATVASFAAAAAATRARAISFSTPSSTPAVSPLRFRTGKAPSMRVQSTYVPRPFMNNNVNARQPSPAIKINDLPIPSKPDHENVAKKVNPVVSKENDDPRKDESELPSELDASLRKYTPKENAEEDAELDPAIADIIKSIADNGEASLLSIASSIVSDRAQESEAEKERQRDAEKSRLEHRRSKIRSSIGSSHSLRRRASANTRSSSARSSREKERESIRALKNSLPPMDPDVLLSLPDPATFPLPSSHSSSTTSLSTSSSTKTIPDPLSFIKPSPLPKLRIVTKFKGGNAVLLPASEAPLSAVSVASTSTVNSVTSASGRSRSMFFSVGERSAARKMNRLTLVDPRSPMGGSAHAGDSVAAALLVARIRQKRAKLMKARARSRQQGAVITHSTYTGQTRRSDRDCKPANNGGARAHHNPRPAAYGNFNNAESKQRFNFQSQTAMPSGPTMSSGHIRTQSKDNGARHRLPVTGSGFFGSSVRAFPNPIHITHGVRSPASATREMLQLDDLL